MLPQQTLRRGRQTMYDRNLMTNETKRNEGVSHTIFSTVRLCDGWKVTMIVARRCCVAVFELCAVSE